MRLSPLRFTVRRLMIAVLAVALGLFAYRVLPSISDILRDDPYPAFSTTTQSWDAGRTPSVTADVFEGWIQVLPSPDGKVTAKVTAVAVTKLSQSDADRALGTIKLTMDQRGDSVRIVARGASEDRIRKDTFLELHVPQGVHLDLRTGRGEIRVGRDYLGNVPLHRPIAASSVRARNDSKYRLGYAEGSIMIETSAIPRAGGGSPIPTRLQLDAPGQIEILADFAVVEARAWHGRPPDGWTEADYKTQDEGSITFEGSLAEGAHSLRAAHRITMRLSAPTALRVTGEAVGGSITGDLLTKQVEQREGRSQWIGSVGSEPRGELRLRTDDGPITLDRKSP
jgi:hypothetical protein